jgi:hypothetical protein
MRRTKVSQIVPFKVPEIAGKHPRTLIAVAAVYDRRMKFSRRSQTAATEKGMEQSNDIAITPARSEDSHRTGSHGEDRRDCLRLHVRAWLLAALEV